MRCQKSMFIISVVKCSLVLFSLLMLLFSIILTMNIVNDVQNPYLVKEEAFSLTTPKNNQKILKILMNKNKKCSFVKKTPVSSESHSKISNSNNSRNNNNENPLIKKSSFLLMSQSSSSQESSIMDTTVCGKNWSVYIFAFSLGAFWNVKHLKKLGII